jgi:hypothetical protein
MSNITKKVLIKKFYRGVQKLHGTGFTKEIPLAALGKNRRIR